MKLLVFLIATLACAHAGSFIINQGQTTYSQQIEHVGEDIDPDFYLGYFLEYSITTSSGNNGSVVEPRVEIQMGYTTDGSDVGAGNETVISLTNHERYSQICCGFATPESGVDVSSGTITIKLAFTDVNSDCPANAGCTVEVEEPLQLYGNFEDTSCYSPNLFLSYGGPDIIQSGLTEAECANVEYEDDFGA